MTPEQQVSLEGPTLPVVLQEGERQPSGYYSFFPLPSELILEYNILQLLMVYLENRGPFTAHSKAPSSSPGVQIQCRGGLAAGPCQ